MSQKGEIKIVIKDLLVLCQSPLVCHPNPCVREEGSVSQADTFQGFCEAGREGGFGNLLSWISWISPGYA